MIEVITGASDHLLVHHVIEDVAVDLSINILLLLLLDPQALNSSGVQDNVVNLCNSGTHTWCIVFVNLYLINYKLSNYDCLNTMVLLSENCPDTTKLVKFQFKMFDDLVRFLTTNF